MDARRREYGAGSPQLQQKAGTCAPAAFLWNPICQPYLHPFPNTMSNSFFVSSRSSFSYRYGAMSMTTAPPPAGFPVETDLDGFFLAAFLRLIGLICIILPTFLTTRVIEIHRHVQELVSLDSGADIDWNDS